MITIGLCGIATYLLFAFLGLGAYVLVVSPRGIRPTTLFVFPPFFGCGGVIMALTHCLSWRLDIPTASVVLVSVMGAASLGAVVVARRELTSVVRRAVRSLRWLLFASTGILVGLLLLWSASREGRLNSPYRQGIDQVGYITTAAVLMDGATLDTIEAQLLADTMARDRAGAMRRISSAVDYTNQVTAVFLFGAVRWGFSLLLVFLTTVLRLPHVAIAVYPLIAVSLSLLLGLVFLFCRRQFHFAGFAPCLAVATSVSLNANMLNVAFDGQLGQAFCLPFFFAVWWQFTSWPPSPPATLYQSSRGLYRQAWSSCAIATLAAITILPTYGEFVILLFIMSFLSLPADVLLSLFGKRSGHLKPYCFLISSVFTSLMLLGGFGVRWLMNVIGIRFGDIHLAGWMQSHWANPLEILGFRDIYETQAMLRSYHEIEVQVVAGLILLPLVVRGIAISRIAWSAPWAGPPIFVALVYCKTRLYENIHNYQYMKSYTTTGPLLFILFAGSVLASVGLERSPTLRWQPSRRSLMWCRVLAVFILVAPAAVGLESLRRFHVQSHFLCLEELESLTSPAYRNLLSRCVVFVPGPHSVATHVLAFQFPFHWLHKEPVQEVVPYREWPVVIYLNGHTKPKVGDCVDTFPAPVVRNQRFAVWDTGLLISDLLDTDGRSIDWSRLQDRVPCQTSFRSAAGEGL